MNVQDLIHDFCMLVMQSTAALTALVLGTVGLHAVVRRASTFLGLSYLSSEHGHLISCLGN